MPSIRDLKKDVNFVLGDIIEAVYIREGATLCLIVFLVRVVPAIVPA